MFLIFQEFTLGIPANLRLRLPLFTHCWIKLKKIHPWVVFVSAKTGSLCCPGWSPPCWYKWSSYLGIPRGRNHRQVPPCPALWLLWWCRGWNQRFKLASMLSFYYILSSYVILPIYTNTQENYICTLHINPNPQYHL